LIEIGDQFAGIFEPDRPADHPIASAVRVAPRHTSGSPVGVTEPVTDRTGILKSASDPASSANIDVVGQSRRVGHLEPADPPSAIS